MDRACESGRTFVSLVDANLWKQVEQQSGGMLWPRLGAALPPGVRAILQETVSLLSMRDDGGRTILLSSVEFELNALCQTVKGDKNCVKYLLKAGANIQRVEGEISLSELAARCDDEQLVKLVSLAETSLPDLRSPSPGLLAYLRCQASFAIDRVITPKAYALVLVFAPLRPGAAAENR
ncbi:hypothetical protein GUITHDRAFT_143548 [Guillardia theta CCMP2712]|uniref:Uncharacterized protein n=1 Tax=Guillardia theta (strain CCMP2712) TaxID=905079 RepID=L1ITZ1_GUITC|nr:hypothetical protein GUITHDRAFT_143548 [Guillardia theta CCMP2712]EKX39344.1 hypothetical protein GUITHDRAFT_143548 [Guillardia theta CCMP2712]|eukprot:XP_005826324.1 hypothetical protein GUITHDRAFT_143548 [Guillardia theta CCMP2712]